MRDAYRDVITRYSGFIIDATNKLTRKECAALLSIAEHLDEIQALQNPLAN